MSTRIHLTSDYVTVGSYPTWYKCGCLELSHSGLWELPAYSAFWLYSSRISSGGAAICLASRHPTAVGILLACWCIGALLTVSSVMCQFNLAPARILWAIVQKSDYLSRNIEQLELVTAQNHSTRRKEIVPFHLCTTKSTNTSSGVEETMLDHLL